eukprot:6192995-Pleurochrysis_carterae.AAC.2
MSPSSHDNYFGKQRCLRLWCKRQAHRDAEKAVVWSEVRRAQTGNKRDLYEKKLRGERRLEWTSATHAHSTHCTR